MGIINPTGIDIQTGIARRYKDSDIIAGNNALVVNQTAHGFSVLNGARYNGSSWVAAQANSLSTLAEGVVIAVIDTNNFVVINSGYFEITHGKPVGLQYYLDASTAGGNTSTRPTIYQGLFITVTTTLVHVNLWYNSINGVPNDGSDNQILTRDSANARGYKWSNAPSSGAADPLHAQVFGDF